MIPATEDILAVSPPALVGWAKKTGWRHIRPFRYADEYGIFAQGRDETAVLPYKRDIGDYASRVWDAVKVFANVAETDELSVLRELLAADRDLLNITVTRLESRSGNEPGAGEVLESVRQLWADPDNPEDGKMISWSSDGIVARRSRFSVSILEPQAPGRGGSGEIPERGQRIRDLMETLGIARYAIDSVRSGAILGTQVDDAGRRGATAGLFRALRGMSLDFMQVSFSMEGAWRIAQEPVPDEITFTAEDSHVLGMADDWLSILARERDGTHEAAAGGPWCRTGR